MQIFLSLLDKIHTYDLDGSITIDDLKNLININEFIPKNIQTLSNSSRLLYKGTLEDNNIVEGSMISLTFPLLGGTRYKKSSSQMRWKWRRKRIKRLQRKRRKMRNRAK
tara:strand:+ start:124 stop:450 length:327 start_codon:yes stop_codon:yes gene_type:complete